MKLRPIGSRIKQIDERLYPRLAGYHGNLLRHELVVAKLAVEWPSAEKMGFDLARVA